jgi:hypothetical protein
MDIECRVRRVLFGLVHTRVPRVVLPLLPLLSPSWTRCLGSLADQNGFAVAITTSRLQSWSLLSDFAVNGSRNADER